MTLRSDGSLWAGGWNAYGQLGDSYIVGPIGGSFDWGPPAVAPGTDTDLDGMPDSLEVLAGTDPLNAASFFRIEAIEPADQELHLHFDTVAGRTYKIEFSDDLRANHWSALVGNITGTGAPALIADPFATTSHQRYYRIMVLPP